MNESNTSVAEVAHRNEDPLTHEPGAHPVATGVGAAGGGAAFAAIGLAVGGPVGGMIGALLGAVAGGLGGSVLGETLDPTDEEEFTRYGLPSHDEIAVRAYFYYLSQGRPEGQDVQHWLAAEHSLRTQFLEVSR